MNSTKKRLYMQPRESWIQEVIHMCGECTASTVVTGCFEDGKLSL
jgi:hypothetical protein